MKKTYNSFNLLTIIIVFNLFSLLFLIDYSSAQKKYFFNIRIDDIQSRGTQSPRSILKFSEMTAKHNAKITWCVIPHRLIENQNKDGVLAKDISETLQKYGFEVYQHGYNHICPKCGQTSHEMYCSSTGTPFSYDLQRDTVMKGYKILQDSLKITPNGFVAPGHAEDSTTFRVLSDLGFKYISFPDKIIGSRLYSLINIPVNQEFTWSLTDAAYKQQMENALADIESNFRKMGFYSILLHDPFIREGYSNGIVIKFIDELLTSLEKKYGDTLQYKTLTGVANSNLVKAKECITANTITEKETILYLYPNPFNSSINISWDLPDQADTKLCIYDSKGSKVFEKNYGNLPKGKHYFNWNGNNFSSGTYFLKIFYGNKFTYNKVLLLK